MSYWSGMSSETPERLQHAEDIVNFCNGFKPFLYLRTAVTLKIPDILGDEVKDIKEIAY